MWQGVEVIFLFPQVQGVDQFIADGHYKQVCTMTLQNLQERDDTFSES